MFTTNKDEPLNSDATEIMDVMTRPDTQRAIRAMKQSKKKVLRTDILRFMEAYKLPLEAQLVIEKYFAKEVFDFTLMRPRILIEAMGHTMGPFVNDEDFFSQPERRSWENKRVILSLSPNVTQPELEKFIKLHWKNGIAPYLAHAKGKPTSYRVRTSKKTHDRIIALKLEGLGATKIAAKLTDELSEDDIDAVITPEYVRKVLQRKGRTPKKT